MQMKEEGVLKFFAAGTYFGGTNLDLQMEQYIYRKSNGIYTINLENLGETSADSLCHCWPSKTWLMSVPQHLGTLASKL